MVCVWSLSIQQQNTVSNILLMISTFWWGLSSIISESLSINIQHSFSWFPKSLFPVEFIKRFWSLEKWESKEENKSKKQLKLATNAEGYSKVEVSKIIDSLKMKKHLHRWNSWNRNVLNGC